MNNEGKTIGEMLRAAREAKNLTVEQVNRETRISIQTIRSLERDDFGAFPSETYLKGFLRNYAEFLGLDGNALWSMVASRAGGGSGAGPSWEIETALKEEKLGPPPVIRRLILPVLVLLVVLFVWMWLREKRRADRVEHSRVETVVEIGATG
ncbi:MAG: helix-turn-helix domain-containing protein [Candidatus Latescibacteria bacterium]|nr:helix-turn-helix domain-containing protein [Candidatus Latescibacterota bacterium]